MNDKQQIEQIRARPSMYGLRGTYHETAMLLLGFDLGRSGGLLRGFTEWLVVRKGELSSFTWSALALQEALPGTGPQEWRNLTPAQERQAVGHLFDIVLDLRDDGESLARMYTRYHALTARAYEN